MTINLGNPFEGRVWVFYGRCDKCYRCTVVRVTDFPMPHGEWHVCRRCQCVYDGSWRTWIGWVEGEKGLVYTADEVEI